MPDRIVILGATAALESESAPMGPVHVDAL
jgi:hypothetical protein